MKELNSLKILYNTFKTDCNNLEKVFLPDNITEINGLTYQHIQTLPSNSTLFNSENTLFNIKNPNKAPIFYIKKGSQTAKFFSYFNHPKVELIENQ